MFKFFYISKVQLFSLILFSGLFISGKTNAQVLEIINYETLNKHIESASEEVKVFNFWASWCKPCVEELPHFKEVADKYSSVKFYFISLDFAKDKEKASKILEKKGIASKVYLLDEINPNSWIDKVDKTWSGAIPATLFVDKKRNKTSFFEKSFSQEELIKEIHNFISD